MSTETTPAQQPRRATSSAVKVGVPVPFGAEPGRPTEEGLTPEPPFAICRMV